MITEPVISSSTAVGKTLSTGTGTDDVHRGLVATGHLRLILFIRATGSIVPTGAATLVNWLPPAASPSARRRPLSAAC